MRKTDKSELLNYLQEIQEPSYDAPQDMEMVLIDCAGLVHMNTSKHRNTYGESFKSELGEKLKAVVLVTSDSKNDLFPLLPSSHKETDPRIFVYLIHEAQNGIKRVLIKTIDTDVVVITRVHFLDLEIDGLWVEFGAARKKRWLAIHVYVQHLGKQRCLALLFWYAFIGCDTVSSFNGRRKKLLGMCGKHFLK